MGKEGYTLHYWQTPRDPMDALYTVLDTSRPSKFSADGYSTATRCAQFLCARRLFFPTAFSFELPGEARPLPFKPCPFIQDTSIVERVNMRRRRLHCCLLRHACRLRPHCLIYDCIVLCLCGGWLTTYIVCQGMWVQMCAPRQNCNISKRYLRAL